MSATSKRNWANVFTESPFKTQTIKSATDLSFLSVSDLTFMPMSFSSESDKRVKYGFVSFTRDHSGLFVIKSDTSNKIVSLGSSVIDLYEQIGIHIRRYHVDINHSELAVVHAPAPLVGTALERIKQSYRDQPTTHSYEQVLYYFTSNLSFPREIIDFVPLFSTNKSTRHRTRTKTNIAHLGFRPGVYFIEESRYGSGIREIVYIGKSNDLRGRIYAHFVPSQINNQFNANYCSKLLTHEYRVWYIEVPKVHAKGSHLLALETYCITQFDPRDNRKKKPIITELSPDAWFDEGFEEAPF